VKQLLNTIHEELERLKLKKNPLEFISSAHHWDSCFSDSSVCGRNTFYSEMVRPGAHGKLPGIEKECRTAKKSQTQILENIKENKVKNTPSKYSGSGFMISPSGYVVTSYHVIKQQTQFISRTRNLENSKHQ